MMSKKMVQHGDLSNTRANMFWSQKWGRASLKWQTLKGSNTSKASVSGKKNPITAITSLIAAPLRGKKNTWPFVSNRKIHWAAALDLLGLESCYFSVVLTLLRMKWPWDGNAFTHMCSSCSEVLEVVEMYSGVGKMAIKFYYQIKPHS